MKKRLPTTHKASRGNYEAAHAPREKIMVKAKPPICVTVEPMY